MQVKKLKRRELDVISRNNGLSLYLQNLATGRRGTPHSWLYEHEEATKTLERWIPLMKGGNSRSPFASLFNEFDLAQVKKFGQQGAIPPFNSKEVSAVIEPLYTPSAFDDPFALQEWFPKADVFGKMVFRSVRRARPLQLQTVVDDAQSRGALATNSGWPRFTRRAKVREAEVKDALLGLAFDSPAIILFRFYYGKLRPVWMFPMAMNLVEMSFQQPIQSALASSPLDWVRLYLTPWAGYSYVKSVMTYQWHGQQVASGDTTKMDAHMRPAQLSLFYEIVKWLFQDRYWDQLRKCILHVTDIDLVVSDTTKLTGIHGLASGSAWTQLSETVLQLFMAWNAGVTGQGIGDDFFWLSNFTANGLVKYLEQFGLPANAEKQSVGTDSLTFLQRLNHQGFFSREDSKVLGAYYPTVRALESILWPERFHRPEDWNSDMFCTRNYTILENCVDDPCFDEFVRFVAQGHTDMIPFSKQSASKLNAIQAAARRVPGLFPSYNQEKVDKPLSAYASIQFAKTL